MLQYTAPIFLLVFASAITAESTTANDAVNIDDVARDYRIRTYDTYRLNRTEYDRRIQFAAEATLRFETADTHEQMAILEWFVQSANSIGVGGVLPPLPAGDVRSAEQLADDAVRAATESISARQEFGEQTTPKAYATSIVKNDKIGVASRSRTFSILGSVRRALTSAAVNRASNTTTELGHQGRVHELRAHETRTNGFPQVNRTAIEAEPTAAVPMEDPFDFSDEDLELDELILESPVDEEPLAPTPETFEREAQWNRGSSVRFAERIEKLKKAIHRVSVRLDMPGMTVEQIEGAVELAEDMCWNYQTLATYLNATGGDISIMDARAIRSQVSRLQTRLDKGLNTYKRAVQNNPSISRHIVKLEELILRAGLLKGEAAAV